MTDHMERVASSSSSSASPALTTFSDSAVQGADLSSKEETEESQTQIKSLLDVLKSPQPSILAGSELLEQTHMLESKKARACSEE